MPDQTRTPTPPPITPGRAVDIVHAAAQRQGLTPGVITARFSFGSDDLVEEIWLNVRGRIDEGTGRAVFAALGVTGGVVLSDRYGSGPQADLIGQVPVLGTCLHILIGDLPTSPAAEDVDALVAEVDAARAAEQAAESPEWVAPILERDGRLVAAGDLWRWDPEDREWQCPDGLTAGSLAEILDSPGYEGWTMSVGRGETKGRILTPELADQLDAARAAETAGGGDPS